MGNPSVLQIVRRSVNFHRKHGPPDRPRLLSVEEKILKALEDARDMRSVLRGLQVKREVCPTCKRRTVTSAMADHPVCYSPGCKG